MRFIPIKMQTGIDDSKAELKDGNPIYICPICKKETQDILEVYYGRCHGQDTYKLTHK